MQSLKFLGTGSGFTFNHTNAYFETATDFVLLDISMMNLEKLLLLKPYEKETYVLITHMHPDHVSGLAMLIQWYFYKFDKKLIILSPSIDIYCDIYQFLFIQGVQKDIYEIKLTEDIKKEWFVSKIQTNHAPELNSCWSYMLRINGKIIFYTGDTNDITWSQDALFFDEAYIDVSASYGGVHLKFDDVKDILVKMAKNADIFIMHIDDMDKMKNLINGTKLKITETN